MSTSTQADANRMNLALVEESTYGETPSGPPTLQDIRYTSDGLAFETTFTNSSEIRSDRQIPDVVRTGASAAGELGFELSYGAFDVLLEAGLFSADWTAAVTNTISDSQTIASNVITRASGSYLTDGYLAGQWVLMSNWDDTENNTYGRISALTATTMTITGPTLTDDATGETDVTILAGGYIKNGTECRSFSIEKEFTDVASTFSLFRGMVVDTVGLTVSAEEILTGTFGFLGKDEVGPRPTSTAGDGSNTASAQNAVMNAVDNLTVVYEGAGLANTMNVTSLSLSLANNLRARLQASTLGAISIGSGSVNVTGSVQSYFENQTQMNEYLAATQSAMAWVFTDSSSNVYILELPAMRFTAGRTVATGQNTDIIADLSFTAFRDSVTDQTIRLTRFPAA